MTKIYRKPHQKGSVKRTITFSKQFYDDLAFMAAVHKQSIATVLELYMAEGFHEIVRPVRTMMSKGVNEDNSLEVRGTLSALLHRVFAEFEEEELRGLDGKHG